MPNASHAKSLQVIADLTLSNSQGDVRITNNSEGDLIIRFPNQKSFFKLLDIQWPFKPGWSTLSQLNRKFYGYQQSVIIQVEDQSWLTLGKFPRPRINYRKVTAPYINNTPFIKTGLYILAAALGATLLFSLFRKRN